MATENSDSYDELASSLNDVLKQADSLELHVVAALIAQALDLMTSPRQV